MSVVAGNPPAYDTQWWQELDLTGGLPERFSYLFAGFSRVSDNDPNPALTGAGGFLTFTHGMLAYSLGYLRAQVRLPSNGARLNADLPSAAVTGTVNLGSLALSNRLRAEDLIGVPRDPWRYRNRVDAVESLRGIGPLKALAFSDEIFIDANTRRLTRNRLLIGPVVALAPRVDIALEYVYERDVGGRPGRIRGAFLDVVVRMKQCCRPPS